MAVTLKYAHLCDYAGPGNNNKALLIGIFDQLQPPVGAPLQMPLAFFAAKLEASIADGADHAVSIVVRDADEQPVHTVNIPLVHFNPSGPGRPLGALLVLHIGGMQFPERGDYTFQIVVDNEGVGEAPLYIVEPPPA